MVPPIEGEAERNVPRANPAPPVEDTRAPLFAEVESADYRKRWSDIQTGFGTTTPGRRMGGFAGAEAMSAPEGFANERTNLEHQWDRGDKVTTEDSRIVLRRYRSFFDRLLSIEIIKEEGMLYTLAVILLIAWLLGLAGTYTIGSFVHALLVLAVVLFVIGLLSGRRPVI